MPPRHPALLLALPLLAGCGLGLSGYAKDSGDTATLADDEDDGGGGGGSSDTGFSGSGGGSGGDTGPDCVDADGDGVDTCSGDCDDDDAATHPGAAEKDDPTGCMRDADGDGWGDAAAVSPVVPGTDCDDTTLSLQQDDQDGDGASTCDGDCDDFDGTRSPLLSETPFDGVDSDCDGDDGGAIIVATGTGGLGIYDYSTTTSTAAASGCGAVLDLEITLDITHTYRGDLTVDLIAPGGTAVRLHDRSGSSSDNLQGTYAVSGGTLTPAASLSGLVGQGGDGTWTLSVTDNVGSDQGTLNSWSVTLWCSG